MFWFIIILIIIILIVYFAVTVILPMFNTAKDINCKGKGYLLDREEDKHYYIVKSDTDRGKKQFMKHECRVLWELYNNSHEVKVKLCDYAEVIAIKWKRCDEKYIIEIEMADLKMFPGKYHLALIGRDLFTKDECNFYGNPNIPNWFKNLVESIQNWFRIDDVNIAIVLAVLIFVVIAIVIILVIYLLIKSLMKLGHKKGG